MLLFKLKYVILISIFISITGCRNHSTIIEEFTFYEGTNTVKTKCLYENKTDKDLGKYTEYYYSEKGELYQQMEYLENKPNGLTVCFDKNGKKESESILIDESKCGVVRCFDNNNLISEILVLNEKRYILKKFFTVIDLPQYGYYIYELKNDTAVNSEGQIIFNDNTQLIDSISFYYKVNINDTIHLKEKNEFDVDLYLFDKNSNIKSTLYIGNLNDNLTLKDTLCQFSAHKLERTINCSIEPQKEGYQLLQGRIEIENYGIDNIDTLGAHFTFYKMVYVVDK